MPLTVDEYTKIAKTILYCETTNLIDGMMVNKKMMFSILNDYCPDMSVSYVIKNDQEGINFLLKEK